MTTQKWRTLSRVFLMLMMTVHVVTWYTFGMQTFGSIGIEAFFSGLARGVLNTGFVFWIGGAEVSEGIKQTVLVHAMFVNSI